LLNKIQGLPRKRGRPCSAFGKNQLYSITGKWKMQRKSARDFARKIRGCFFAIWEKYLRLRRENCLSFSLFDV